MANMPVSVYASIRHVLLCPSLISVSRPALGRCVSSVSCAGTAADRRPGPTLGVAPTMSVPMPLTGGGDEVLSRRSYLLAPQLVADLQAAGQVSGGGVAVGAGAPETLQRRLVQLDAAGAAQLVTAPARQAGRPQVVAPLGGLVVGPLTGPPLQPLTQLREVQSIQLLGEFDRVTAGKHTGVVYA